VRDLPNDCRRHQTHTVASTKQTISPSSQTTSNPASALWANSEDYRIKHQK